MNTCLCLGKHSYLSQDLVDALIMFLESREGWFIRGSPSDLYPNTSGVEVRGLTQGPEKHAVIRTRCSNVSYELLDWGDLVSIGKPRAAQGFAVIKILEHPNSGLRGTHDFWAIRSMTEFGWAEVMDPNSGEWFICPPRQAGHDEQDRVFSYASQSGFEPDIKIALQGFAGVVGLTSYIDITTGCTVSLKY